MSEHDDDHTAPWNPALGRRTLLRAGGALGAAGAAGTVGALTAAPALADGGTDGTKDRWLRPGDEGYEEAVERYWSDHRPPGWRMALFGRPMDPAQPPLG